MWVCTGSVGLCSLQEPKEQGRCRICSLYDRKKCCWWNQEPFNLHINEQHKAPNYRIKIQHRLLKTKSGTGVGNSASGYCGCGLSLWPWTDEGGDYFWSFWCGRLIQDPKENAASCNRLELRTSPCRAQPGNSHGHSAQGPASTARCPCLGVPCSGVGVQRRCPKVTAVT